MRHVSTMILAFGVLACAACGAGGPGPETAEDELASPDPGVPIGFVRVTVMGVLPTADGNALLLRSDEVGRVLPVFIGDAEASVIQLRLAGEHFERPLTHDLLDAIMERLGGDLVRVLVTKLRGDVFLGTVVVRRGDRYFEIDARPSDAVALAVGHNAAVYVAKRVLEAAGLSLDEVMP
jgi:hypothetical protein